MTARADLGALIDVQRVARDHPQASGELGFKLAESRQAAPVALDRHDLRPRVEQGTGQSARTGPDLIDALPYKRARNCRDPRQQLAVENEILPQRLGRLEPVAGDHIPERFSGGLRRDRVGHPQLNRYAAHSIAIRIAAAIARGSARSWPAMSNAVPWSGDARTIGSPSVMLTPSSKCKAFRGISA